MVRAKVSRSTYDLQPGRSRSRKRNVIGRFQSNTTSAAMSGVSDQILQYERDSLCAWPCSVVT